MSCITIIREHGKHKHVIRKSTRLLSNKCVHSITNGINIIRHASHVRRSLAASSPSRDELMTRVILIADKPARETMQLSGVPVLIIHNGANNRIVSDL